MEGWRRYGVRGARVRSKHRKTRVREEGWPLIDDWYWCPLPVIEERIDKERVELQDTLMSRNLGLSYEFLRWEQAQYVLNARLAHKCEDGTISAPTHTQWYKKSNGGISLYGKCKRCETKLGAGVKTIIILSEEW